MQRKNFKITDHFVQFFERHKYENNELIIDDDDDDGTIIS